MALNISIYFSKLNLTFEIVSMKYFHCKISLSFNKNIDVPIEYLITIGTAID